MFKKALGIEAAGKYEYHICQHGKYVFPNACGQHDYASCRGDHCQCSEPAPRFTTDVKGKLCPHKVGGLEQGGRSWHGRAGAGQGRAGQGQGRAGQGQGAGQGGAGKGGEER